MIHAQALPGGVGARGEPRVLVHGHIAVFVEVSPLAVEAALDPGSGLDLVRDPPVDVEHQLRGEAVVAGVVITSGVRCSEGHRPLGLIVLVEPLGVGVRTPLEGELGGDGARDLLEDLGLELSAPGLEELFLRRVEGGRLQTQILGLVVVGVVVVLLLLLLLLFRLRRRLGWLRLGSLVRAGRLTWRRWGSRLAFGRLLGASVWAEQEQEDRNDGSHAKWRAGSHVSSRSTHRDVCGVCGHRSGQSKKQARRRL